MKKLIPVLIGASLIFLSSCAQKTVRYLDKPVPNKASLAIIVNTDKKQVENVIMTKFLARGFNVKAMNFSDLYTTDKIYDIRDFKKASYRSPMNNSLLSMEKSFNNIYKLHIYNYELNKAQTLQEIRQTWNVEYLMLMDLKDWGGVTWGRLIDLRTMEIVWIENYRTRQTDSVESVVDHFIDSISKK